MPELVPRELIPDTVSLECGEQQPGAGGGTGAGRVDGGGVQDGRIRGAACVFALNSDLVCGRDLGAGELEAGAAVQVGAAVGADCGVDPLGAAVCAVCAGSAGFAGAGVYVYVFHLGDLVAAGGGGAQRDLKQGPLGYGILNGSLGLGAVVAAYYAAPVRRRFSADQILAAATFYNVVVLVVLALCAAVRR